MGKEGNTAGVIGKTIKQAGTLSWKVKAPISSKPGSN